MNLNYAKKKKLVMAFPTDNINNQNLRLKARGTRAVVP